MQLGKARLGPENRIQGRDADDEDSFYIHGFITEEIENRIERQFLPLFNDWDDDSYCLANLLFLCLMLKQEG